MTAHRDRAGRDEHDLAAVFDKCGDLIAEGAELPSAHLAVPGQGARAYLDDDPPGALQALAGGVFAHDGASSSIRTSATRSSSVP